MVTKRRAPARKAASKSGTSKTPRNAFGLTGATKHTNYRGRHGLPVHVEGINHQGKTRATTSFDVMPTLRSDRHPGEKLPLHRKGNKLF